MAPRLRKGGANGGDSDVDPSSNGDDGSTSYSPPSTKHRQPGTTHPLTVGAKKAIRDGAQGVYIAFAILTAHQLMAALVKLLGYRRGKGFQRTTKFRVLMVLMTMALLSVYALGIAYTRMDPPQFPGYPQFPQPYDPLVYSNYRDQITTLFTLQIGDDFLAKLAQWLVILSTLTLIYDYLAYKAKAEGNESFRTAWSKDKGGFVILYLGSSALVIAGAVQLGIFIVRLRNGEGIFPGQYMGDTQEVTRKAVAWVFAVCFGIIILSLRKIRDNVQKHGISLPELKAAGIKYAIRFLTFLMVYFVVNAILITTDSINQDTVKLVEITVVGGLTCSIVWSLLWESGIKVATKTGTDTGK